MHGVFTAHIELQQWNCLVTKINSLLGIQSIKIILESECMLYNSFFCWYFLMFIANIIFHSQESTWQASFFFLEREMAQPLVNFTSDTLAGSSIPSGFVLWVMKDIPHRQTVERPTQSRVVTLFRDRPSPTQDPQWRTAVTSSNKVLAVLRYSIKIHRFLPLHTSNKLTLLIYRCIGPQVKPYLTRRQTVDVETSVCLIC